MKTTIFNTALTALCVVAAWTAGAQEPQQGEGGRTLDRQVNVTQEYRPDVAHAAKLSITPDMRDTVALRPEFSYTIQPRAWMTGFGVAAINPVKLNPSQYNPVYPFYLKAGVGYPLSSTLDFYLTTTNEGRNGAGVYVNHRGQFSDIKNDMGQELDGAGTTNTIGAFGRVGIGARSLLEGELAFDYDSYSRYGRFNDVYDPGLGIYPETGDPSKQHFMTPRMQFTIGNDFVDLSRFSVRGGAGGAFFKDKYDNRQTDMNVFAEIGKGIGNQSFGLKAGYEGSYGKGNSYDYKNHIVYAAPRYGIVTECFTLDASLKMAVDMEDGFDNEGRFLPSAKIEFIVSRGRFIPFASLDSRIVNNGYRSLSMRNPYVSESFRVTPPSGMSGGLSMHRVRNSTEYETQAGFRGTFLSNYTYKVYGGYELVKNPVFFYNASDRGRSSQFDIVNDRRMSVFSVGGEFEARYATGFSAGLGIRYNSYSLKELDEAIGMPSLEGTVYAGYNYKDRLSLNLKAVLIGERHFMDRRPGASGQEYYKQDMVADISLEAEYRLNSKLGVFLQGNNLANSKLYRYSHYREVGINAIAGVKLTF